MSNIKNGSLTFVLYSSSTNTKKIAMGQLLAKLDQHCLRLPRALYHYEFIKRMPKKSYNPVYRKLQSNLTKPKHPNLHFFRHLNYYLTCLLYLELFVIAKSYLTVCSAWHCKSDCKQNLSKFLKRVSSFLMHKSVAKDKHKKMFSDDIMEEEQKSSALISGQKKKVKCKVKLTFLWALSSSKMSILRGTNQFRW